MKRSCLSGFLHFSVLFLSLALLCSAIGIFMPTKEYISVSDETKTEITVVIDAGHGGEDGGACTYGGLSEKELNLLISADVCQLLSAVGINVVMTRTEDVLLYPPDADYEGHKKSMDLAERLKIARQTPGAILVSIHMNAFPEPKYGGLQVYYSKNSDGGKVLATFIQSGSKNWLDPENSRSVKAAGRNIYLLDRFEGTGVLIECGFLSNPHDRANLNDPEYRKKLATVISFSIIRYISEGGV